MIFKFSGALLLISLALLIAPALSAPILFTNGIARARLLPHTMRSPLRVHHRRDTSTIPERDIPEYAHLVARDGSSFLDARSYDKIDLVAREFDEMADSPLYKREDAPTTELSRRGLFSKIKKGFQKAVGAVKSGVTTAFQAVKQTAVTAVTAVKNTVVNVAQKVATVAKTATAAVARPLQRAVNRIPFIKAAAAKVANVLKTTGSYIGKGVAGFTGGIRRVGAAVKAPFRRIGTAVSGGLNKAATWTKKNGAKVAKIGLKAYATYTKTGSRIANFIPVVGKPISKGLSGVSKVANFGSDHIHAKLTTKEQKSIKIMNKIQNPLGGVAGKVMNAVLKRDEEEARLLERDGLEGAEVFERDLIEPLEARSFDEYELFERDVPELDTRSLDELEARSWNYEEEA